ncbi:helix-turn-helix domain-containing protein [Balneatrix alpica]|uniref:Helix-turn-helix domain-containing protein n=1 Tax=Balneatrix alpica TaxID=75684 RepID=A0ABV5ZAS9_9GAMM|nr:helix-turn-helix domain-containing protein [Balneatrix alpica]
MRQVAILAYPDLCTFEFGCAVELFALPRPEIPNWYQTRIVSLEPGPLAATGGIQILTEQVQDFSAFDTLIIPGWHSRDEAPPPSLQSAMRSLVARGGRILSFCSGAFLLAGCGLLDGRRACTHWRYADAFRQRFPQVELQAESLYVLDEQLGCSAGSAAGLDLGLALIRRDFGADIANSVAKRLVLPAQRDGGQAQFIPAPTLPRREHPLHTCLEWAQANLQQPIRVEQLCEMACMSRRSFDRHMRQLTGLSPQAWLTRQRLQQAQAWLETSDANLEQIAQHCGFGSALNLRHHFQQSLGISPQQYRRQFSTSLSDNFG